MNAPRRNNRTYLTLDRDDNTMKLLAVFDNCCLALSLLGVSLFFTAILLNNLNLCIYLCDESCFPYIYACHSALRLVRQEPESSQTTDMALACCFLGKVLGVVCHYFPPPLDIPSFAARYLQICTTREILLAKGGLLSGKFTRNDYFHIIFGIF